MRPSLILVPLALAIVPAIAATSKEKPVAGKTATKPAAAPSGPHIVMDPEIRKAADAPGRSDADRARDKYRHPVQTLSFFGLKPDMTVVEVIPGGGWYTAILAPYLAASGQLIEAVAPGKAAETFAALVQSDPARYGKVQTVAWSIGQPTQFAPPGTADRVLTFRNIHNLLGPADQPGDGSAPQAFADWFAALKPGGILGIEEHRLPETMDVAREKTTGYIKRSTVIRLALAAGFQLAGVSDINANPQDDHDHPKGVWTLPPSYALGDVDKAKYAAIGESDRMTLIFAKPGGPAGATDAKPADPAAAPETKPTPQ